MCLLEGPHQMFGGDIVLPCDTLFMVIVLNVKGQVEVWKLGLEWKCCAHKNYEYKETLGHQRKDKNYEYEETLGSWDLKMKESAWVSD